MAENRRVIMTFALVIAFLLSCFPGEVKAWGRPERHVIPPPTPQRPTLPPVFDPTPPTNVTVTAMKTAILSCIVHNLGNNSVSWIRHRDLHILSVGAKTYANDDRFVAVPKADAGDWTLRLQYANTNDTGQYDCQVSTKIPTSRTVQLTVIQPRARIPLAPEMHVGVGSPINLTCIVSYSPEPPDFLHWYHKDMMVRADGSRVWVQTHLGRRTHSHLLVTNANSEDSGLYTCSPAHSQEHSIQVYVSTGEYPAAMQGGSSVTAAGWRYWAWSLTAAVSAFVCSPLINYFYM